jgi:hypothetical protein
MPLSGGLTLWGDQSIVPAAARTTTTTGDAVNITGYEQVWIVVTSGTITDGTHTFSLTECATSGGSYTAVAAANIIPAATGSSANGCVLDTTAAHDSAVQIFGYTGTQPYIKVVCTVTGSPSTGGVYCATVLCGKARHQPVATP